MATFQFTCPHCSHTMELPDTLLGKQGNCSACREVVLVTKTNCPEQVLLSRKDTKSRVVELEGLLADVLFAEDSPAKSTAPLNQIWQEQRQLSDRMDMTQSILDRLEAVLPEVENRQNEHLNAAKQLKRVNTDIELLEKELGQSAMQAVMAGNIARSAIFEERIALYQRLAALETEKAEIGESTNADWKDQLKSKSRYVKVSAQIKVEALKVGGLDKAIGRTLLSDGIEETMRCSETSAVLDRVCIKRTEQKAVNEVETAASKGLDDILQTASAITKASPYKSVASVQSEIKGLKRQLNEISKLLTKNSSVMLEAAQNDATVINDATVGPELTELLDLKTRLEETKPGIRDIAKIAGTGWGQISRRTKSVVGVAITVSLLVMVWIWANQEDVGQVEIAASNTNSAEETNSQAEDSSPTPESSQSSSAPQDVMEGSEFLLLDSVPSLTDGEQNMSNSSEQEVERIEAQLRASLLEFERVAAVKREAEKVAAVKRETERIAAEQESVRIAAEQEAVRIAAEQDALRIAAVKRKASEALTLEGHSDIVRSVAFSPDGKRIVSGSDDTTVKIWDAETGTSIHTIGGHSGWVMCVSFSPDGKHIVSGSDEAIVKVWDAETGTSILTLKGHSDNVNSVVYSPDGKRIASGSCDTTVGIWDAEKGTSILTLKGHSGWVMCLAFSPDGKRIVSSSADKTLKVWDAYTGSELLSLEGHPDNVNSVAYSPDGKRIVSGCYAGALKVWDAETGTEMLALKRHSGFVRSVGFSLDGKQIVSSSADKTLKVWDAYTGRELLALEGHPDWNMGVSISPDMKHFVNGSRDGTLKVWGVAAAKHETARIAVAKKEAARVATAKLESERIAAAKREAEKVAAARQEAVRNAARVAAARTSAPPVGKTPQYIEIEKRLFQAKVNGEITVNQHAALMTRAYAKLRRGGETSGDYWRRQLQFLVANGTRQESEDTASLLNAINKVNARGGNLNAVSPDLRREVSYWLPFVNQK
ncbi:MAG: hypothetical protein NZ807_14480 [Dehalococcoidia bacterium]|nr:hypothetical protein [Dehalococcoidia bacterium]